MSHSENDIAAIVFETSRKILEDLGPGLLEKAYEQILAHELEKRGLNVKSQVPLDIEYDGIHIDEAFRLDLLVEDKVIIELKAVESLHPIYKAQLLTYLKLTHKKLGLLINFNTEYLGKSFTRVVNGLN